MWILNVAGTDEAGMPGRCGAVVWREAPGVWAVVDDRSTAVLEVQVCEDELASALACERLAEADSSAGVGRIQGSWRYVEVVLQAVERSGEGVETYRHLKWCVADPGTLVKKNGYRGQQESVTCLPPPPHSNLWGAGAWVLKHSLSAKARRTCAPNIGQSLATAFSEIAA